MLTLVNHQKLIEAGKDTRFEANWPGQRRLAKTLPGNNLKIPVMNNWERCRVTLLSPRLALEFVKLLTLQCPKPKMSYSRRRLPIIDRPVTVVTTLSKIGNWQSLTRKLHGAIEMIVSHCDAWIMRPNY